MSVPAPPVKVSLLPSPALRIIKVSIPSPPVTVSVPAPTVTLKFSV